MDVVEDKPGIDFPLPNLFERLVDLFELSPLSHCSRTVVSGELNGLGRLVGLMHDGYSRIAPSPHNFLSLIVPASTENSLGPKVPARTTCLPSDGVPDDFDGMSFITESMIDGFSDLGAKLLARC